MICSEILTGIQVPPLPGLPVPGHNTPLPSIADLVTLQSIQVSSGPAGVSVQAQATVVDPVPLTFNFTSPSLPFIVSLPRPQDDHKDEPDDNDALPVASVHTAPFSLTHPNITLSISGTLLPVPHTGAAAPIFSAFLAAYLLGRPNPITVATPLFPALGPVHAVFPGPDPKPDVLRGVTIRDLRIKPPAGLVARPFLASGTIVVRVVLPRGIDVDVNVTRVLPDVLVLDGEPPAIGEDEDDEDDDDDDDALPPRAFARIQPADWLPSVTARDEEEEPDADRGSAYVVSAKFCDVPLQVLPGRDKVFRGFLSKVCLVVAHFGCYHN